MHSAGFRSFKFKYITIAIGQHFLIYNGPFTVDSEYMDLLIAAAQAPMPHEQWQ